MAKKKNTKSEVTASLKQSIVSDDDHINHALRGESTAASFTMKEIVGW